MVHLRVLVCSGQCLLSFLARRRWWPEGFKASMYMTTNGPLRCPRLPLSALPVLVVLPIRPTCNRLDDVNVNVSVFPVLLAAGAERDLLPPKSGAPRKDRSVPGSGGQLRRYFQGSCGQRNGRGVCFVGALYEPVRKQHSFGRERVLYRGDAIMLEGAGVCRPLSRHRTVACR